MMNQFVYYTAEEKWGCISEIIDEPRNAILCLHSFSISGKIDMFCQKEIDSSSGVQERTKMLIEAS